MKTIDPSTPREYQKYLREMAMIYGTVEMLIDTEKRTITVGRRKFVFRDRKFFKQAREMKNLSVEMPYLAERQIIKGNENDQRTE